MTEKQLIEELSKEEVNVYAADCGEVQYHCNHDCFGGGALLSTDY